VRQARHGERVEGRTAHDDIHGEYFACRVVLGPAREVDDRGRRKIVASGQLVARTDDLRASDSIEIDGEKWQIVSLPEVLRARSSTPITTASIERVVEPAGPVTV